MNGNENGNECGVRDERERERGAGLTATPARCGLNGNGNENAPAKRTPMHACKFYSGAIFAKLRSPHAFIRAT